MNSEKIKKRYESNLKILNELSKVIRENKEIRFKQALIGLNIIKDSHNSFNEESVNTLKKLNQKVTVVSCLEKPQLFVCRCTDNSHQIIMDCLDDKVYCQVHLCPDSFWERLKNGIRYIFGHRSKYGDFAEFIFNPEDADKLQEITDYLKKVL